LVPAIFVPFHGVPTDKPLPKDRDEKLRRILEDLDKHQDAVRRNMMYLVTLQKEKLLSDAKEALESENARYGSSSAEIGHVNRKPELQQDIKELLDSLKEPAVKGTSGKEYQYEDGDFDVPSKGDVEGVKDAEGDATMSGMDGAASRKRNIHHELNSAIRDLALGTAAQIEMYDKHAETTKDYYRRALERHNAREGLGAGSTTGVTSAAAVAVVQERLPGGILRNTNSEIRINTEALARMAQEDHSLPPSQPIQSAIDVSRDPRRSSVDFSRDPRRGSGQFAQDWRKPSMDGSRDVWRR
jgi:hypothetical protein